MVWVTARRIVMLKRNAVSTALQESKHVHSESAVPGMGKDSLRSQRRKWLIRGTGSAVLPTTFVTSSRIVRRSLAVAAPQSDLHAAKTIPVVGSFKASFM